MGFLNKLFRRTGNTSTVNATGQRKQSAANISWEEDQTARENASETRERNRSGERLLRQRIEEAAAREKPEYELRRNVSSREVGAPQDAEPTFDYGFYKNGILAAVIMILDDGNGYRRRSVRLAQMACGQRGVTYMNFMSYMMNRPEYISQRLQQNLR
ncbi:MAG: hypothetical protein NC420_07460 [Eubacterium sp.]|nr:hypothetical protein [Eubacterium sp.]